MRKIVCMILTLVLVIGMFGNYNTYAAEVPKINELYALSAAMIDGDTGRVLYEKEGYNVRAMASTTKIMTLIIALEYGNLDDMVTVSSYAAKMPDVQLGIKAEEQYMLSDLMYSLMLESHNDSAVAIAEHVGGSVEGFAKMMNAKAKELGLSNTYFITPNGLDAVDDYGKHSTTAVDLGLVMKYCVMDSPARDQFIKICQTREHSFADYDGKRSYSVHNKNALLDMMDGVVAGKTGFTADAGYCYVCAVTKDNKTLIITLLGCGWPNNKSYKWSDTKKMLSYGFENYSYNNLVDKSYVTDDIPILNGIEADRVGTYTMDEIGMITSKDDVIDIRTNIPDCLEAPVYSGEIVGRVDIYVNSELYTSLNVYAAKDVNRVNFKYYLQKTIRGFLF